MTLLIAAPAVETNITSMSETGLIVLSVGAILCCCALLIPVMLAGRAPRRRGPAGTPPPTGPVQGGVHAGDGRSVAPHRDAPAEGLSEETAAQARAGDRGADSGR